MRLTLAIAAPVILLDQLSKWLIVQLVMQPPRVIELAPVFNLVLTYNSGVSFGILGGAAAWKPWLLSGVALVIVIVLLLWLRRQTRKVILAGGGLVVGGALGNVVDRLHSAAVIDFLDFHLSDWHWPAFNLADGAISVGVALLIFDGLFPPRDRSKQDGNQDATGAGSGS